MKGKLLIALVVLALVFGFVLVSCDDGVKPDTTDHKWDTYTEYNGVEYLTNDILDYDVAGKTQGSVEGAILNNPKVTDY